MKKKSYEAPEVLVVQLTQCAMLANSGGDEIDRVRERNPYDDMNEW